MVNHRLRNSKGKLPLFPPSRPQVAITQEMTGRRSASNTLYIFTRSDTYPTFLTELSWRFSESDAMSPLRNAHHNISPPPEDRRRLARATVADGSLGGLNSKLPR